MASSMFNGKGSLDMFGEDDYDYENSSDNCQSSVDSEDEIDAILCGSRGQQRKLQQLRKKWGKVKADDDSSSSGDDFEKEMDAELTLHVRHLEDARGKVLEGSSHQSSCNQTQGTNCEKPKLFKSKDEFYDDVYFDSDEEYEVGTQQDVSANSKKTKHKVISNEDLLYDPSMDDIDQKWVDEQRQSHIGSYSGKECKKANSDALLDCPACLTTLCIDCQRHETIKTQYRAMFVMNCTVDTTETLECPEQPRQKKKKGKSKQGEETWSSPSCTQNKDQFNPVRCSECNTIVGVFDYDEVYHFFNVIASHT